MDNISVSSEDGRKRILFLVSSMRGGGAERVAALLCNHWAAEGHEVTLMPTFSGRGECLYPLDTRVRLDYLADRVGAIGKGVSNMLQRFLTLRRVMQVERPEVVVSFLTNVNVAVLLAAVGLSTPVVVSERSYPPLMPTAWYWRWLRRLTYPLAHGVVMQTDQGRAWLRESCPNANGYVIPNPVVYPLPVGDPQVSPTQLLQENRRWVLAVGRLGAEKGFDELIQIFARLADDCPRWDLVIVGEGPERARLEASVAMLELKGRVYLPGRVGNLGEWYSCADVYVMCSRFEGFPNTLLEALAHGLPAVSIDCDTGPRDIIRNGVDGILVPKEQGSEGLSDALMDIMNNEPMRTQMGKAAVEVRMRYSIGRISSYWKEALGICGTDYAKTADTKKHQA